MNLRGHGWDGVFYRVYALGTWVLNMDDDHET
jgi:hypothetical protein